MSKKKSRSPRKPSRAVPRTGRSPRHPDAGQVRKMADDLEEARRTLLRLLARYPDSLPALNALSVIDFAQGKLAQAVATARRILDLQPDDFLALGNLARYLYLGGHPEQAREQAERLMQVQSSAPELPAKQAETLSYLGDDQGVVEAFRNAERMGFPEDPAGTASLYHLAAAAALRLGQENRARRWWRQALQTDPGLEPARANLRCGSRANGGSSC